MKINQFLDKLKTVKDIRWTKSPFIRGTNKSGERFCPITAVFHQEKDKYRYLIQAYPTGRELGLSFDDVDNIVKGADGQSNEMTDKIWKILSSKKDN